MKNVEEMTVEEAINGMFGILLRHLREMHDVSREELAAHLDITSEKIAGFENGEVMTAAQLALICQFFYQSADFFIMPVIKPDFLAEALKE